MVVSVVIPCYRSGASLKIVVEEICQTIQDHGDAYQIILVNDCSPDNTFEFIEELCARDRAIVGIDMSRNFGQETAIVAGLGYVTGDVVVVMDDDGQHPAKEMFKLIEKVREGYDIVYASFPHKSHSLFKRMTSALHGKISEFIGTKPKNIALSSFWALSAFCASELAKYQSPFTSRGGYLMRITQRFANVEIEEHRSRIEGKSNYNLKKLFALWFANFTNFSIVPIRVTAAIGALIALAGFIYGLVLIIQKILNPAVMMGFTSLMAILLFVGGVIILMIGFIGEYIGRTYMTVSSMPQFIVRRKLNATKEDAPRN
jgi:undecaprenyl-phosphate 4-deoxy-4-formamido-L-arabinose transferase